MGYQTVFRRYEKKYLVTQEQYDRLAAVFAPRMERDRFSESTISNIYYDTPDFRLIRRSLDRPAYKEKLRLRTYRTPHADTEAFVEIKKKYDLDLARGTRGRLLLDPSVRLMEIKIPGAVPVWLARALSDAGVFPSHFSKYGAAYQTMQREEKTIRFNEKGEIYCA